MPVMNGLDAALQIKRSEDLSNPPRIVMVTAASRTLDDEPEERLAAVETVLTKPVNASMLLDALMFAIEGDDTARDRRRRRVGAIDERKLYPIRGASILLVEDNEINQEVALEFLKLGQFKVDIANNGVECLERLNEKDYDCVLMDIHMPEMDGFEATRQIRAMPRYTDLPVLAMTANVMDVDVEESLAAGMNAHIAKPIVPNTLFSALLQWIEPGVRSIDVVSTDPSTSDITLPQKLSGCDLSRALLNVNGNRALLDRLLRDIVADHSGDLDRFKEAVASGNQSEAIRITHSLKTVFGTLGSSQLQIEFASLERQVKTSMPSSPRGLIANIEQPFQQVMTEIEAWSKTQPNPDAAAGEAGHSADGREDLQSMISTLREALDSFSAESVGHATALARHLDNDGLAQQLVLAAEQFDYERALALLETIPEVSRDKEIKE